jgi:arylsulfatase A-like enzyme/HEAT repeat protein
MLERIPVGWRIADAYLAIVALAYAELYAVGFLFFRQFAGAFEISSAVRGIMPVVLAAAAPGAVVLGILVEVIRGGAGRFGRIAETIIGVLFASAVAYGVASGRRFEGGLRIPFALGLGVAVGILTYAAAPLLSRALVPRRGPRGAAAIGGTALVIVVLLEIANVRVLPRLYPAFHLGLLALTLLIAAGGALAWTAIDPEPRAQPSRLWSAPLIRVALSLGLFALGAATVSAAARRLSHLDNVRLIYLDHAPILGRVIELSALIAPPGPLDDTAPLDARASGHAIDLKGRDLVLISVDALRADHTSAYGYERKTTPNLDRLAEQGVVFEAAYSPTPHTSYAVTSVMTGKYMRPLLLQGLGADSETWAEHLRRYGYRTAAFYPPAVFFIDGERFEAFRERRLDFEYQKIEFAPASARVDQVRAYLSAEPPSRPVFLWVHLFEPHEPYEAHPEHPFGDRDVDRYDAEIAAADAGVGAIVAEVRQRRPSAVVIVTADHGEEFSEHGGRYHGTTVYEEQVRVPLVVNAPGLLPPHKVSEPVELIALLPTVLAGLEIPRPARVRGADLGPLLAAPAPKAQDPSTASGLPGDPAALPGFAFAETDTQTMLAKGSLRLICARKIAACALYDIERDPGETTDIAGARPAELAALRAELRAVEASHGRYEKQGLRSEGKGWPEALRRGIAGDGDAATDVAALLDDADVAIRRKAAEVLFELGRADAAAELRLALVRDEDDEVKRWCALSLTRIGEGAPRTRDLLHDPDPRWRRLAALALAESGDDRGADILVAWFREAYPFRDRDNGAPTPKTTLAFERAREIVAALGKIREKNALFPLLAALEDIRLRPYVAEALAALDEDAARPPLAERLAGERYQVARLAIANALVKLGGGPELRAPLVRFLGTPDPLPEGIRIALDADILELVGGPRERDLSRLRRFATSGVAVGMVIPKAGNGTGIRVICRARTTDGRPGEIRVGLRAGPPPMKRDHDSLVPKNAPALDAARSSALAVPAGDAPREVFATFPPTMGVKPGGYGDFIVYATQNVAVAACAVVPLSDELPPPPPEPWVPSPEP